MTAFPWFQHDFPHFYPTPPLAVRRCGRQRWEGVYMKLRIGMRVKKVRGYYNVGATGTVVALSAPAILQPCDLQIRYDTAWQGCGDLRYPGSEPAFSVADQWEPILDSDQSAEDIEKLGRDLIRRLGIDTEMPVTTGWRSAQDFSPYTVTRVLWTGRGL